MEYSQNEVKINLAHECLGLAKRFMDAYVEKRYADIPYTIKYGKYIPGVTCSARCLTRMKEIEIYSSVLVGLMKILAGSSYLILFSTESSTSMR